MSTRPDPTAAELLAAARALLARAEAMMREPAEAAPTPSKPEPIGTWGGHEDWIPWSGGACPVPADALVQYVMRDHGTQQHPHIGQDPADNLRWNHHHEPAHPMAQNDIIAYRLATPAPRPEPVGTWGGYTDWIPWSGGACPVPADAVIDVVFRSEADGSEPWQSEPYRANTWSWDHIDIRSDVLAYRLVTPAAPPVQEPAPAPAGVVLRGWEQDQRHPCVWNLLRPDDRLVAWTNGNGWSTDNTTGPETGLLGKEQAVDRLLADGAAWASPGSQDASGDHDTRAINRFRPGDVAVMTDGSQRTVEETTRTRILFADGTWLSFDAAETAMAARIPAAAKT